jgi:hypothetical protein
LAAQACAPTICGKSSVSERKQRSLGTRAKRRLTVALSEIETDDQSFRKVLILIGRGLMLNYFFQLFLDSFERVDDRGDGSIFCESILPFFLA